MNVYRQLTIEFGTIRLDEVIARLEANCRGGWQHDTALEHQVAAGGAIVNPQYCFTQSGAGAHSPTSVWLVARESTLSVANILSPAMNLSVSQFNEILENFYNLVASPAAAEAGFKVALTADKVALDDLVPTEVSQKLIAFSRAANKRTGSTHPYDMERWLDFLTEVHSSNHHLTSEQLERWLCEDEQFPQDIAADLARQFEFSEELLGSYDYKRSA